MSRGTPSSPSMIPFEPFSMPKTPQDLPPQVWTPSEASCSRYASLKLLRRQPRLSLTPSQHCSVPKGPALKLPHLTHWEAC